jgi:hypothetical protein
MDSFTIAFWKEPVSRDDSNIELHELHEAGLVHASVNRTAHSDSIRYAVDINDPDLKARYGRIVLAKTSDNKWKVVNAMNSIENIFIQLTEAIENADSSTPPRQGDPHSSVR